MPADISASTYPLKVLTTEYIIEGTVAWNTELHFAAGEPVLWLNSVALHPLHPGAGEVKKRDTFILSAGGPVVAYIPEKDPSLMRKNQIWQQYTKPARGIFRLGPYLVEGTMMFLRNGYFEPEIPVLDACVTLPGGNAAWSEIRAPFILMNRAWLFGYEPLGE